jgi:hypothetical protein
MSPGCARIWRIDKDLVNLVAPLVNGYL